MSPSRSRAARKANLATVVGISSEADPSIYEQTRQALSSIDESLAILGFSKHDVLNALVYLADMSGKADMNRAWDEWAPTKYPPVRACVGAQLEPGYAVEIVVTAVR